MDKQLIFCNEKEEVFFKRRKYDWIQDKGSIHHSTTILLQDSFGYKSLILPKMSKTDLLKYMSTNERNFFKSNKYTYDFSAHIYHNNLYVLITYINEIKIKNLLQRYKKYNITTITPVEFHLNNSLFSNCIIIFQLNHFIYVIDFLEEIINISSFNLYNNIILDFEKCIVKYLSYDKEIKFLSKLPSYIQDLLKEHNIHFNNKNELNINKIIGCDLYEDS